MKINYLLITSKHRHTAMTCHHDKCQVTKKKEKKKEETIPR